MTFTTGEMDILCVGLNSTNLNDANVYEDDPKTIILVTNFDLVYKLEV